MRPRFQADADFNQKIVLGLGRREPAIDFWDARAGGVIGLADSDVLHKATDFGRILISHDRKTMPAHFARFLGVRSSPGLIIVPQELAIGGAIDDLLIIWAASDAEEWRTSSASSPYKQVRSATTRRISLLASKPKLR